VNARLDARRHAVPIDLERQRDEPWPDPGGCGAGIRGLGQRRKRRGAKDGGNA